MTIETKIEELKKEFAESPAIKRLYALDSTAIITGRAEQYTGEIVPDLLDRLLTEAINYGIKLENERIREEVVLLGEELSTDWNNCRTAVLSLLDNKQQL